MIAIWENAAMSLEAPAPVVGTFSPQEVRMAALDMAVKCVAASTGATDVKDPGGVLFKMAETFADYINTGKTPA